VAVYQAFWVAHFGRKRVAHFRALLDKSELVELIDKIEYWYYSTEGGQRVRYHKFVHFYLMRGKSGDVQNHDREVDEARWVGIDEAAEMLAFRSEQEIVQKAKKMIVKRKLP